MLPSQAGDSQLIRLPGQTRVSPEEYKEFLGLGHGDVFDLDPDRSDSHFPCTMLPACWLNSVHSSMHAALPLGALCFNCDEHCNECVEIGYELKQTVR